MAPSSLLLEKIIVPTWWRSPPLIMEPSSLLLDLQKSVTDPFPEPDTRA
jgi:hypothetical protein